MPLLGLDRQSSDRTGVETLETDRLTGFLAIAVGPIIDPLQGSVDLRYQLALTIACPEFDGSVGFG